MMFDIEHGKDYQLYTLAAAGDVERVCRKHCRYRGAAFKGGVAGRCLQGIIELYDIHGHPLRHGSVAINAALVHRANVFGNNEVDMSRDVYINTLDDNKFEILYMVDIAGTWSLSVTLPNGQHIAGSPFDIEIDASEASPYTTTLTEVPQNGYDSLQKVGTTKSTYRIMQEFIIQARDGFGNNLKRGGTKIVATCLGDGSVLSLTDCKNGTVGVDILSAKLFPSIGSFSTLRCLPISANSGVVSDSDKHILHSVTLMGKDIVNSPFTLSSLRTAQTALPEQDPFEVALNKYKIKLSKHWDISDTYSDLCVSLIKEQREAVKSYHATRLQIVHTLPVMFVIDEPDGSLADRRKELIAKHNSLNREIEELSAMLAKAEASRKDVVDDLLKRFETSAKIHKDAVGAYNIVCRDIEKQKATIEAHQGLIHSVKKGDKEAISKLDEIRDMDRTMSAYYSSSEKPEKVTERLKLKSRQYMGDNVTSNVTAYKPDRPNTLAFWMMEGRFKPQSGT